MKTEIVAPLAVSTNSVTSFCVALRTADLLVDAVGVRRGFRSQDTVVENEN